MSAPPPPPPTFDYRLVVREDEAREALERYVRAPLVGLDTEAGFDYPTRTWKLTLAQLYVPGAPVLLLDLLTVDAGLLRPLVESPEVLKAAHNARFDEGMFLGVDMKPRGFVDTLRLAQAALDLGGYGLADVVRHLFGFQLDKTLQKSAWRRRPLTPAQLQYAAADAVWTYELYRTLEARLRETGEWEAELPRALLAPRQPKEPRAPGQVKRRAPAPEGPPPPPLTPEQLQVVESLKRWRMKQARAARIAVYMVCPDRTLEECVRARPASLEALGAVYGFGPTKLERYGAGLLEALREAMGPEAAAQLDAPATEVAVPAEAPVAQPPRVRRAAPTRAPVVPPVPVAELPVGVTGELDLFAPARAAAAAQRPARAERAAPEEGAGAPRAAEAAAGAQQRAASAEDLAAPRDADEDREA